MKITTATLARVCVALLVLYPSSAIVVSGYLDSDYFGIMAALFCSKRWGGPSGRPRLSFA